MTTTRTRLLGTLAAGALAATTIATTTLGLAGPAQAAGATYDDPSSDSAAGADILNVHVIHGDRRLRVIVQHDNLVRSPRSNASGGIFVDLDADRRGPELELSGGLFDGTDYALQRIRSWQRVGGHLTCPHRMVLHYDTDRSVFSISRDCLGGVDQVRVAVRTSGRAPDGGQDTDWLGGRRHFSDWVARG